MRRKCGVQAFLPQAETLKSAEFTSDDLSQMRGPRKIGDFVGSKFGWFAYYCWAAGLIVLALTLVLG